jgi:diguanylate cyclase (GGDEF)-like protein/PAS domain S-box-containing protein
MKRWRPALRVPRLLRTSASWRELLLLAVALVVTAAMVAVSEVARDDANHHARAQVLVETIRASSQELNAIRAQTLADQLIAGRKRVLLSQPLVAEGFRVSSGLAKALIELRRLESDARTETLQEDVSALYGIGLHTLAIANGRPIGVAVRDEQMNFGPAMTRLNADAQSMSEYEQRVAASSSSSAETAFITSLAIGLLALLLIGMRFQRLRRRNVVEEERRQIEQRSEARLRALVERSTDVVSVVDADLVVRWQAASIKRVLGYWCEAVVGRPLTALVHPDDAPLMERFLKASIGRPNQHTLNARFIHADGGWRAVETVVEDRLDDPAIGGLVLNMRDVTERKKLEDELRHQAFHDSLTGLANRSLFEGRMTHALAIANRRGRSFGVLFLDLDDFKTINDSLGHARGDELLRAVGQRIHDIIRPTDTAARLGGDEFALLVEVADEDEAHTIARRILDALALPFMIGDRELRVTASMGIALWAGASRVDDLLRNADMAMYAAKADGKASIRTFEPSMHARVLDRLELTGELREAIETREFELDYQPIVELDSGRIVGVEALVRWQHPVRGRLPPEQFIGLAEETGLIVPLGMWILSSACKRAREWSDRFPEHPLQLSVNVSTRQLHEPDFIPAVGELLSSTGLAPEMLVLEITESLLLGDRDEIVERLEALKALGLRVAVDDFGTGYSSLSHLRHFPLDILKIDRSFVDGIDRDAGKAKLVHGIINLGDSLLLDVVAEGIERPGQADEFRGMQAPLGQGFLFFPPLPAEEIESLLAGGAAAAPETAELAAS